MRHSGLSMQPGAAPVAWPPTARRTRPNWLLVLLGVAALHLLLLQLLQPALRGESPAPTAGAPVLIVRRLPPPRAAPPPPEPRAEPQRRAARTATPRPAAPATTAPTDSDAERAAQADATAPAPADAPTPTAGETRPAGGLLDSEASRRTIRDAGRRASTAELGAQASGASAPAGAQQRLAQEIARGAIGDCLKGEYAGSGMGLLSLPFWVIAELRDKCRR